MMAHLTEEEKEKGVITCSAGESGLESAIHLYLMTPTTDPADSRQRQVTTHKVSLFLAMPLVYPQLW